MYIIGQLRKPVPACRQVEQAHRYKNLLTRLAHVQGKAAHFGGNSGLLGHEAISRLKTVAAKKPSRSLSRRQP